jgi:hypothetical protein
MPNESVKIGEGEAISNMTMETDLDETIGEDETVALKSGPSKYIH